MTLNEEQNLRRCIEALQWTDDIIVLDSESTDSTREIAEALGCRVVIKKLANWSEHQNWALLNLPFRHEWVLNIDADEIVSPELAIEIQQAIARPHENVAFRVRRKDYFLGTWIKHASFYPLWLTRLYKPKAVQFERLVNPVANVDGPVSRLQEHLIHYPFSKGISHWFERHNSYSSFEAEEYFKRRPVSISSLFVSDVSVRRQALKRLFSQVPFRPFVKFVYLYFLHFGFLDGKAGLYYTAMQSFYEFMISVKLDEMKNCASGRSSEELLSRSLDC